MTTPDWPRSSAARDPAASARPSPTGSRASPPPETTSRSTSSISPRSASRRRSPTLRRRHRRLRRAHRPFRRVVVVTPEYNHGYPASLKQAIDIPHAEWQRKAVGFVSYGGLAGGMRAVEQLRQVFAELHCTTVRETVSFHEF